MLDDDPKGILDATVFRQVTALCRVGAEDLGHRRLHAAIAAFEQAFALLPEPRTDWEVSSHILSALGDAYFLADDFVRAREALQDAMHGQGAAGPFLHLRLGQCQLELGDERGAEDELLSAFRRAGPAMFRAEHPKYLTFLRSRVDIPA